jgi:hypothetical protein
MAKSKITNSVISGYRAKTPNVHRVACFVLSKLVQEQQAEIAELKRQLANSSDAVQSLLVENERHSGSILGLVEQLETKGVI